MLEQLHIRNFAVTRSVDLTLNPGLTVFTGETGAGKSLVVDALAFAFGARRGREIIASGAERAEVGVSWRDTGNERRVERSVAKSGRTAARIDGATASTDELHLAGASHLDIHGQSEQLTILRPAEQLRLLDQFAGMAAKRAAIVELVRELRAVRRQRTELTADQRERERLIGQLQFETEEIAAAGLEPGEDVELRAEAARLGNVGRLRDSATMVIEALSGMTLGQATAGGYDIAANDDSAIVIRDATAALEAAGDDLLRATRAYVDQLDEDPERLTTLQERLDLIARLRRKYGDSIEEILAYHATASSRLEATLGATASLAELDARETSIVAALTPLVEEVSKLRRIAASRLVTLVQRELVDLGMARSSLGIGFASVDDTDGLVVHTPDFEIIDGAWEPGESADGELVSRRVFETGVDRVEFLASFNAGESPRPLASVASGGETSRFLLALTAVLSSALEPRTIVFDEVDEGVGGRAGSLVGSALARLSERHQVLCITHLPQVAAFADTHFVVAKETDGGSTWSSVAEVSGADRVEELAEMLGGATEATRSTARELLGCSEHGRQEPGRRRGGVAPLAAVNDRPRR